MIRSTDALSRSPLTGRIPSAGRASSYAAPPAGARVSPPSPGRPGIDRALGDALSIAQMSQNIIQRAITISLQLKSIAASAMASGRVNQPELSRVLSEMQSTLGRFGEHVAPPAQTPGSRSAKIPDMPDFGAEMKSLRVISDDFRKGAYDRTGALDGVIRGLGEKLAAYRTAGDALSASMRESSAAGAQEQPISPHELVSLVQQRIASNPSGALTAQGNINHATANRLMV